MLARRLGLEPEVIAALEHAYERWDGTGDPAGLKGEEIPLARIAEIVTAMLICLPGADKPWSRSFGSVAGKAYDRTTTLEGGRCAGGSGRSWLR